VKKISILGATGSIGKSTLDLIERSPEHFEVAALTASVNATAAKMASSSVLNRRGAVVEAMISVSGLTVVTGWSLSIVRI